MWGQFEKFLITLQQICVSQCCHLIQTEGEEEEKKTSLTTNSADTSQFNWNWNDKLSPKSIFKAMIFINNLVKMYQ